MKNGMLIASAIIFGGTFLLVMVMSSGPSKPRDPAKPEPVIARSMCDLHMKSRLKAPSTAKFAGTWEGIEAKHLKRDKSHNYYQLSSWVDSQNSFGAKIRTKFYCEIKNKIGKDVYDFSSWELSALQVVP